LTFSTAVLLLLLLTRGAVLGDATSLPLAGVGKRIARATDAAGVEVRTGIPVVDVEVRRGS